MRKTKCIVGKLVRASIRLLDSQGRIKRQTSEILHQLTEDFFEVTHCVLENAKALKTAKKDAFFDCARRYEVEDKDLFTTLAKPVDATDSLLKAHWVPGDVIVHEPVTEFVIESFASDL
jgi:hypothetical protein